MRDPRSESTQADANAGGKITGVHLDFIPVPGSKYELIRADLIDEAAAQGQTVARVMVTDRDNVPVQVACWLAWPWKGWQPGGGFQNRLRPGNNNYPYEHIIINKYDPPNQGPLAIFIGDAAGTVQSDVIGGLGLPHGHHVGFHLVFRERGAEGETGTGSGETETEGGTGGETGTGGSETGGGDLQARLERIEAKLDRLSRHFGIEG